MPIVSEGVTTLTYFARDNAGNEETPNSLTVRIDRSGPSILGMPGDGCVLWPPNHKLVQVATLTAGVSVSGAVPGSLSVQATSNEPGGGTATALCVVTVCVFRVRAWGRRLRRLRSSPSPEG